MTELQDEICDRLVGAKVSRNWVGGPIHAAALVLDPAFEPSTRGDGRPRQFSRAVGWPLVFCEAFTGANSALADENDRRSLAITLFSKLPLPHPGKAPRTSGGAAFDAAAWAALRAHPLACSADCPLQVEGLAAVVRHETGRPPGTLQDAYASINLCRAAGVRTTGASVGVNAPAAHHAAVAVRHLLVGIANPGNNHCVTDAAREAAKAEAKVRAVDGAADHCLTLAKMIGMI